MTGLRLALALCLALLACRSSSGPMGMDLRSTSRLEAEFKRYEQLVPHRAMAVAGDEGGRYAMGYAFGESTAATAAAAALAACEERRRDLGLEEDCRLYAQGSEILDGAGNRRGPP